ncbi:hypothetical protein UVI_02063520 [Ustilaginoidea virens]|uniref:LPXTG-domain-containing protein n=1 Tax=Ustilaginoidea virens TaxID=1159556 RepID=A0A1B5L1I3_USTVR|nr:hypothetical protein UVI_02063520 [Ustilaginoidea virens]
MARARAAGTETLLLLAAMLAAAAGLPEVTPNSPCSSACFDWGGLDASSPSGTTRGSDVDIVCPDHQFDTTARGRKLASCLGCLQHSTFSQGVESDQAWFLYNLRYAFTSCVFGSPNGTAVSSHPCATSEACGRLAPALQDGLAHPRRVERLGYCDGVLFASRANACVECVRADGQHAYLSNSIGLNDTIFSHHAVQLAQPASSSPPPLTTPAIVGILVGAIVLVALLSGCVFLHLRKRRSRTLRFRRTLSFRCKTAASTTCAAQALYQDDHHNAERFFSEKGAAMASMSPVARSEPPRWTQTSAHRQLTTTKTAVPRPPPAYSPEGMGFSPDYYTPTSPDFTRPNVSPLTYRAGGSPGVTALRAFGAASPGREASLSSRAMRGERDTRPGLPSMH